MEITTPPTPRPLTGRARVALLALLLGPLVALVLLPAGLGLQRVVVTDDAMAGDRAGSLSRGTLAFQRVVPVSDLRVGDVITFPRPLPQGAPSGTPVTRRIVAIGPTGLETQGDALPRTDPWTLRPDGATLARVDVAIPWAGWVHLLTPRDWAPIVLGAGVVAALAGSGLRRRPGRSGPRESNQRRAWGRPLAEREQVRR